MSLLSTQAPSPSKVISNVEITPQQFRAAFGHLLKQNHYSHAALLDSAGQEAPQTTGLYTLALGQQSTALLKQHQGQYVLSINKPTTQSQHIITHKQQLLTQLETLTPADTGKQSAGPLPGFQSGWIVALGYELNQLFEPSIVEQPSVKTQSTPWPLLTLFKPQHVISLNTQHKTLSINSPDATFEEQFFNALSCTAPLDKQTLPPSPPICQQSTQALFNQQISQLLHHIQQGDIYQANLSIPFEVPKTYSTVELLTLYNTLVQQNPSAFSGVFFTPEVSIVSNSPERLVKYDSNNNTLEARPIAGTRSRGANAEEDQQREQDLKNNVKECAEHLMLVDLMRNDLGQVAQPASVSVPEAFFIERYQHVMHLVSQVEAKKKDSESIWQVLESVFPGGTITGCPKVRCMELLAQIEESPRGFYTGSLGYIDEQGHADFNILIRSLYQLPNGPLTFNAGAGIVADSVAENEYQECLKKAKAITTLLHPL